MMATCFAAPLGAQTIGAKTGLPLPRFVSLKAGQANVRRGPGVAYRIDWRFVRRGMPLQIITEYENWRNVRDREGIGGWVHATLLDGTRTVIVEVDETPMHRSADARSPLAAIIGAGVVARLGECVDGWCQIEASGHEGWVRETSLWGTDRDLLG